MDHRVDRPGPRPSSSFEGAVAPAGLRPGRAWLPRRSIHRPPARRACPLPRPIHGWVDWPAAPGPPPATAQPSALTLARTAWPPGRASCARDICAPWIVRPRSCGRPGALHPGLARPSAPLAGLVIAAPPQGQKGEKGEASRSVCPDARMPAHGSTSRRYMIGRPALLFPQRKEQCASGLQRARVRRRRRHQQKIEIDPGGRGPFGARGVGCCRPRARGKKGHLGRVAGSRGAKRRKATGGSLPGRAVTGSFRLPPRAKAAAHKKEGRKKDRGSNRPLSPFECRVPTGGMFVSHPTRCQAKPSGYMFSPFSFLPFSFYH